jgi:Mn-dependent DtxR family transcriptional regulator
MLDQLLDIIRSGGTRRVTDMAGELQTTPEMVEAMLDQLAKMGYLRVIGSEDNTTCDGCSMANLCSSGTGGRVWALTE